VDSYIDNIRISCDYLPALQDGLRALYERAANLQLYKNEDIAEVLASDPRQFTYLGLGYRLSETEVSVYLTPKQVEKLQLISAL
jgi:hypothetical protein